MRKGVPVLLGTGDRHDTHYDHYARSIVLNDWNTQAKANTQYVLTVYPTSTMFHEFQQDKIPWAVALGFVGAILVCTALFAGYDFLMRNEAHQRQQVLQFKRRFVRFISHEIRTPLNTVCMGMDLLEDELVRKQQQEQKQGDQEHQQEHEEQQPETKSPDNDNDTAENTEDDSDIDFWHGLALDVKENAHCAVSILNDLLNYDKIESGKLQLEIGTVAIKELIIKTVNQFRLHALNSQVDLSLEFERINKNQDDLESGYIHKSWHVIGDETKLAQVLRNLCSNALKFTPANGAVKVTVSHVPDGLSKARIPTPKGAANLNSPETVKSERDGSIRICCKDTGVGLSQEQLKQLFEEGVQFDANKLQHGGGSGLGLVIAKGIIEQHGGTILAKSEGVGSGTEFIVEFPVYRENTKALLEGGTFQDSTTAEDPQVPSMSSETIPPSPSSSSSPSLPPPPLQSSPPSSLFPPSPPMTPIKRGRRILVADDSRPNRKMLVRLLERCGHTCVAVENGSEAVKEMAADMAAASSTVDHVAVDTILMDYEMPIMNGPEAARRIRAMGYPGLIFGVTGNVLNEDIDYFKSLGANAVIPKPINMDMLSEQWEKMDSSEV